MNITRESRGPQKAEVRATCHPTLLSVHVVMKVTLDKCFALQPYTELRGMGVSKNIVVRCLSGEEQRGWSVRTGYKRLSRRVVKIETISRTVAHVVWQNSKAGGFAYLFGIQENCISRGKIGFEQIVSLFEHISRFHLYPEGWGGSGVFQNQTVVNNIQDFPVGSLNQNHVGTKPSPLLSFQRLMTLPKRSVRGDTSVYDGGGLINILNIQFFPLEERNHGIKKDYCQRQLLYPIPEPLASLLLCGFALYPIDYGVRNMKYVGRWRRGMFAFYLGVFFFLRGAFMFMKFARDFM